MIPQPHCCPRCQGLMLLTQIVTPEGHLPALRCVNCGFYDEPVMRDHRRMCAGRPARARLTLPQAAAA